MGNFYVTYNYKFFKIKANVDPNDYHKNSFNISAERSTGCSKLYKIYGPSKCD